jgi:type I restriction enzyme R subunit
MSSTPEQAAREQIDVSLFAAGWVVQDYKAVDLGAGRGIALREVPLKSGRCDYQLLADRKAVGVIEAKKAGATLSTVAEQSGQYGESLPDFLRITGKLPFYYESTGVETFFRDERDPEPRSRRVFSFQRPETLAEVERRLSVVDQVEAVASANLFSKKYLLAILNIAEWQQKPIDHER